MNGFILSNALAGILAAGGVSSASHSEVASLHQRLNDNHLLRAAVVHNPASVLPANPWHAKHDGRVFKNLCTGSCCCSKSC